MNAGAGIRYRRMALFVDIGMRAFLLILYFVMDSISTDHCVLQRQRSIDIERE